MNIACSHCTATNRVPDERLADDPVCGKCGRALLPGEPVAVRFAEGPKGLVVAEIRPAG